MKPWLIVVLGAGASFVVTLIVVAAIEQRDVNLEKGSAISPSSTAADAQVVRVGNQTTARLLALDRVKHLTAWTMVLKNGNQACDVVVRTMYQGGSNGIDSWSVGCQDGNEYSVSVYPDAQGSTRYLTCKELVLADAMMSKRGGSAPTKNIGCWNKY